MFFLLFNINVTYWPSTQPSIEKQVEDIKTLTGWIRCNCDTHGKQVDVKQWYNPVPQLESVSWSSRQWEPAPSRGLGSSGPPVEQPRRSAAIARGTWGQYVAVCSVSNSPLTHNPFATLSNKVWEVYFSKEVCSFVIIVDFVSACICIRIVVSRLYNIFIFGA